MRLDLLTLLAVSAGFCMSADGSSPPCHFLLVSIVYRLETNLELRFYS